MAKKYLDYDGVLYFWQKIKALFATKSDAVKNITRSGSTFTATRADGTTFTFTQQYDAYSDVTAAQIIAGSGDSGLANPAAIATGIKGVVGQSMVFDGVNPAINSQTGLGSVYHYTSCSTAAATAAKTADLPGFSLNTGALVLVKFTVTNTASNPTLNINNTGAKAIYYRGSAITAGYLAANRTYLFAYNGTQYELVGDVDTNSTYSNATLGQGYGTCSTATNTDAKVVTLSGYALASGGVVAVKFTNDLKSSSSTTATTLNINSKGAKNVYYKGSAITSGIVMAGDVAIFMYDGTQYHLIGIDRTNVKTHTTVNGNVAWTWGITVDGTDIPLEAPTVAQIGAAGGICPLNSSSKIDTAYLPSYVDDVIEAYARSGQTALSSTWLSATSGGAALTPETGKIYVLMADSGDYTANSQFRWSGSSYVKLADGGVSAITNAEIDTIVAA